MRLDKVSRILLNLILVLVIVLLLKLLISVPRLSYAQNNAEYDVELVPTHLNNMKKELTKRSAEGWKLNDIEIDKNLIWIIFER